NRSTPHINMCGVGCPIRIPADLGSCAAPRSFSQLYTSFIAYLCQGIHHTPLSVYAIWLARQASAYIHDASILTFAWQRIPLSSNPLPVFSMNLSASLCQRTSRAAWRGFSIYDW